MKNDYNVNTDYKVMSLVIVIIFCVATAFLKLVCVFIYTVILSFVGPPHPVVRISRCGSFLMKVDADPRKPEFDSQGGQNFY